eukprot:TRINITY_DN27200_c0_g1_i1.p2 TRINITY_DN27200_c0_g1~~TRINITY_DN27200_c0_g1_i1.p2  ORF type:complete len:157 (-),score=29.57 TRINITY_DN27200_c0_g1_i1:333-743(-)
MCIRDRFVRGRFPSNSILHNNGNDDAVRVNDRMQTNGKRRERERVREITKERERSYHHTLKQQQLKKNEKKSKKSRYTHDESRSSVLSHQLRYQNIANSLVVSIYRNGFLVIVIGWLSIESVGSSSPAKNFIFFIS